MTESNEGHGKKRTEEQQKEVSADFADDADLKKETRKTEEIVSDECPLPLRAIHVRLFLSILTFLSVSFRFFNPCNPCNPWTDSVRSLFVQFVQFVDKFVWRSFVL